MKVGPHALFLFTIFFLADTEIRIQLILYHSCMQASVGLCDKVSAFGLMHVLAAMLSSYFYYLLEVVRMYRTDLSPSHLTAQ